MPIVIVYVKSAKDLLTGRLVPFQIFAQKIAEKEAWEESPYESFVNTGCDPENYDGIVAYQKEAVRFAPSIFKVGEEIARYADGCRIISCEIPGFYWENGMIKKKTAI